MAEQDDETPKKPEGLEYEKFEELARGLVKVSKEDLDAERERERAEKK